MRIAQSGAALQATYNKVSMPVEQLQAETDKSGRMTLMLSQPNGVFTAIRN